ncbi:MAG: hypothetical protein EBV14_04585 [Actinobacteria bacterium]|nr:hypothetical protein [Actinomycetota bacterium]
MRNNGIMTTLTPHSPVSSDLLPVIVNLEEARERCHEFESVITAGPSLSEVGDFGHPKHKIVEFDDVTSHHFGYVPPTFDQVDEMVRWGVVQHETRLVATHSRQRELSPRLDPLGF